MNPEISSAQPKRKIPAFAIVALILLFLGGLFWRFRSNAAKKTEAPKAAQDRRPTVKTVPVAVGSIVQKIQVTGTLRANQDVNLGSKISGRVSRVLVKEGQRVRRGQLLLTLDDDDLQQQVNAARANLQSAQVRLQQTEVGLPARVAQVNTAIDQARTQLETARARYKQALLNEPAKITAAQSQADSAKAAVSSADARVDQARTNAKQADEQTAAAVQAARASLEGAKAALAEVERGARDQQIASAQAQVNVAEAQLRDAETNLNRQKLLFQGGAAPRANVDTAQTGYDVAKAQLEAARQNLSLVKEGATTEQTRQAQEVVRQREATLAQANADRNRVTSAQSEITNALGALSQSQEGLRQAQANLAQVPITRQETRVAREAVAQAESGLRQALANRTQIPVAQADIPAAQATVANAQAQLQAAQVNFNYAKIYSPINGVVVSKFTDAGQSASPGVTLMNIVSLDNVYFEAQIPDNQLSQIKVGQPAQVNVSSVSNQPFSGYISDIIPVADERLRQFRVRISIENSEQLTPGSFARGTITTQVISNTLVVPTDTIREKDGKNSLLVAVPAGEDHKIERKTVKVGANAGGRTQIVGGVEKGDEIVTGSTDATDGDKVKVAEA